MTSIDSHISSRQIARTAELTGSPEASFTCNVDPTDPIQLRRAFAHVPTPLATAAAVIDGQPAGMVLGSFVVHSLEPALVSVSIQASSRTWPLLRAVGRIGISVLSEYNRNVISNFYRPSDQRFDSLDYFTDGQAILFPDASLHITAEFVEEVTVGDHTMAILQAVDLSHHAGTDLDRPSPLVFHQSEVTAASRCRSGNAGAARD